MIQLSLLLAVGALVLSTSRPVLTQPSRSELASAAITMRTHRHPLLCATKEAVVSPFVEAAPAKDAAAAPAAPNGSKTGPLELTLPNVELVLDEMRPYLIADGGNVAVRSIEGGVVKLELQGACGSCPSSTMTMKMGLERGLLERFPTIVSVEQVAQEGPVLDEAGIEAVLQEIRPFLKMTGGTVELRSLTQRRRAAADGAPLHHRQWRDHQFRAGRDRAAAQAQGVPHTHAQTRPVACTRNCSRKRAFASLACRSRRS